MKPDTEPERFPSALGLIKRIHLKYDCHISYKVQSAGCRVLRYRALFCRVPRCRVPFSEKFAVQGAARATTQLTIFENCQPRIIVIHDPSCYTRQPSPLLRGHHWPPKLEFLGSQFEQFRSVDRQLAVFRPHEIIVRLIVLCLPALLFSLCFISFLYITNLRLFKVCQLLSSLAFALVCLSLFSIFFLPV